MEKDAALERGAAEASELRAAKNAHLERAEHKAAELAEKSALVSEYLERVVKLTEERAAAEAKARDAGTETAKLQARLARTEQEKAFPELFRRKLAGRVDGAAARDVRHDVGALRVAAADVSRHEGGWEEDWRRHEAGRGA